MQSTSQMYSGRTETFASCHRQKKTYKGCSSYINGRRKGNVGRLQSKLK